MTRGEGGWLLLPSAGLSPAILRQFAWRTPAGAGQRRAYRPPTQPRPALADHDDAVRPRTRRARGACVAAARLTPGGVETAHPLPVLLRAPGPHSIRAVPPPPEPATRGFRRQRRERHQAARRCSRRRSPPRVLMAAGAIAGTRVASRRRGGPGCAAGAARPSAPRANHPDRPSLPMTRRQAALATMGLRVCHGRSQQRHALRRCAGRRVAPRAPRSRPPHSHRDRRRDADKSARGQPRHAATSPAARSISAHFHWRKSVPHPVTEYSAV